MEDRGTIATQAWRPQAFGPGRARDIVDAIIEPLWGGDRALLVVAGPRSAPAFLDVDGEAFDDPLLEPILADLGTSLRADAVVLDGYLTRQPNVKPDLAANMGPAIPTHGQMLGQMFLGQRGGRAARAVDAKETVPIDPDLPLSFVAVDLLAIDDQALLDIPLLERKRILETAFTEADHLRLGVYVRAPIGSWLPGWRAFGFREVAYKAANSRYTPGLPNPGWATAAIPSR
ncbi:MAG TPA: hypothetical protein VF323_10990 [Candidatus Limnocylindrales bacterium]